MPPLVRLTIFKIPDPEAVQQAVAKYTSLSQDALKDSQPYILLSAGHTTSADPRSAGYTFVGRTVFASRADMEYYDERCGAHAAIKEMLRGKVDVGEGPPLVLVMEEEGGSGGD